MLGKQFNSLIILEKENWDNKGNDSLTKEFKNQNILRMLEGNASIAPIVEHDGKHKSYILT
ncbi:hypothetical protein [Niallia circulans]|uniref:hypothetical protein n=1 Tax=Niallia circulans TaxID=1397 RepID=UPI002E256AED